MCLFVVLECVWKTQGISSTTLAMRANHAQSAKRKVTARAAEAICFSYYDNNMRGKDCHCRIPATSPGRANVTCIPHLRQRQSFSRTLLYYHRNRWNDHAYNELKQTYLLSGRGRRRSRRRSINWRWRRLGRILHGRYICGLQYMRRGNVTNRLGLLRSCGSCKKNTSTQAHEEREYS